MLDNSKVILEEIENISKEKQIDPEIIYDFLKEGLLKAYERQTHQIWENVEVEINKDLGTIKVFKNLTVVEEVEDEDTEISISEINNKKIDLSIGEIYKEPISTNNFSRLAIFQAIQIVKQGLREAEKNSIYDEFISKKGQILIGTVESIEEKHALIRVGRAYAFLPKNKQIPGEKLSTDAPNNHIKFYLEDIIKNKFYGQILASRTHPEFLSELLKLEVPELNQENEEGKKVIEIKEVGRVPGVRAKVAIVSNDKTIDAVGACIGQQGSRIQNISEELNGEKIDVILYDDNINNYIINALAPSKVVSISIDEKSKKADVIVPDEQFSLAIGKNGMAARLVATLTHWKINILSFSTAKKLNNDIIWNGNLKETEYDNFVNNLRKKNNLKNKNWK